MVLDSIALHLYLKTVLDHLENEMMDLKVFQYNIFLQQQQFSKVRACITPDDNAKLLCIHYEKGTSAKGVELFDCSCGNGNNAAKMASPSGITEREETCLCCCCCRISVFQLRREHFLQVCLIDL